MEKNIKNTFCNPIVLPDYPIQGVLGQGHGGPFGGPDIWGRAGKKMVSEREIAKNFDPTGFGQLGGGGFMFEPDKDGIRYGRVGVQDARATADPSCLYYDGKWFLYCSNGMIYDSEDFIHWTPHYEETWVHISGPLNPMAPTVEYFRGKFYATGNSVPLHVSDTPYGPWSRVGEWTIPENATHFAGQEMTANDPMIFADDDDRLYLYWGLGNGFVFGAELDPEQPNHLITEPKPLLQFDPRNWWERFGANNEDWSSGCTEGSWMYKDRESGKYYLTYSVCGTEYYTYAMGAYISDSPLGEFTVQPYPVSRSREGFIKGGGHGSIVDGPNGTRWCFYTIPVCIDDNMERRIGIDPVGIDGDGYLYALTGCEVPQYGPGVLEHPELGNDTELVPLTVFKPEWASSCAPGSRPLFAIDEALHTYWEPAADDPEPTFAVRFFGNYDISALRIMWKDLGLNLEAGVNPGPFKYVVEYAESMGSDWLTLVDASENETDLVVDYRTFDTVRAAKVRIRILGAPAGITPALINFTVFGVHPLKAEWEAK